MHTSAEDEDEMPHDGAFHQCLHYLLVDTKMMFKERNTILFGKYNLHLCIKG